MSYYQMTNEELMKYPHHWFWVVVLISAVQMQVFPELINDVAHLMSYLEGHNIAPMLKWYRPKMRPYTQDIYS